MHSNLEFQVLRALAVIGLVTAFIVATNFAFDSGVIGGGASSGDESIEAPAGEAPPADTSPGAAAAAEQPAADGAAAPDTTTEAVPSSDKTYTVQDGDSFYSISRKFNISIAEIQQLNPNLDPSNLSPGTTISIP